MGLRALSMRPASVGPVKHLLRQTNLADLRAVINDARARGEQSVRAAVMAHLERAT
jgi:phosphotransferase system enzyme I (PtsP)